ncbi:MAG TPA: RNA 2',3'-cyclic phosphodiesterase [Candidatus Limnocylindrales bacterium]|jgi:2'-5' RNA ligase|nr:RNA 2',3'-cyclic phosphodiesterase [Candidatus Limnocylindrales bacterium]
MAEHSSQSEERLRLFVAIAVPESVKAEITNAQKCLSQALPRISARWTRPDQFHLTLRFLGNVQAALAEQLIDSLRTTCESISPLELRASGLGFFPSAKAPRVVWVGVQDNRNQLQELHSAVEQVTARFTKEKTEERFNGHITLGRLKDLRRLEADILTKAGERFSATSFGQWTAREIHLMCSRLSSQGAEHMLLAAIPLAGC